MYTFTHTIEKHLSGVGVVVKLSYYKDGVKLPFQDFAPSEGQNSRNGLVTPTEEWLRNTGGARCQQMQAADDGFDTLKALEGQTFAPAAPVTPNPSLALLQQARTLRDELAKRPGSKVDPAVAAKLTQAIDLAETASAPALATDADKILASLEQLISKLVG